MVSVSSAVPKGADGNIDIALWSDRLIQGHHRLKLEPIMETASWLSGFGDGLLLQSLELAEMVAELRLDHSAVLAAMAYPGFRRSLFDEGKPAAAHWGTTRKVVYEASLLWRHRVFWKYPMP